jgi:hypothetical protein
LQVALQILASFGDGNDVVFGHQNIGAIVRIEGVEIEVWSNMTLLVVAILQTHHRAYKAAGAAYQRLGEGSVA